MALISANGICGNDTELIEKIIICVYRYKNNDFNWMVDVNLFMYLFFNFHEVWGVGWVQIWLNAEVFFLDTSFNVTRFKSTILHKNTGNKYKHDKIHWKKTTY